MFKEYENRTKNSKSKQGTRYNVGGITTEKSKTISWWERVTIPRATDDILWKIPMEFDKRPDLASYHFYKNNNLEWIILLTNNILDVQTEFTAGAEVWIPSAKRVKSDLMVKNYNTQ